MWWQPRLNLALLLLASACGSANELSGSIDATFALEFDRVEILRLDPALIIEFLDDRGGDVTHKVVKITIDLENLSLSNNSDIVGDVFDNRVKLERITETEQEWPPVSGGLIHFDAFDFEQGGHMKGNFHIQFENGLNLVGKFDGKLKRVSPQG